MSEEVSTLDGGFVHYMISQKLLAPSASRSRRDKASSRLGLSSGGAGVHGKSRNLFWSCRYQGKRRILIVAGLY